MNGLITVIIPVYNAKPYLQRCLNAALAQTYLNFELLLIDDGSTDGSSDICDMYAKEDCRVYVIHQSNRGVAAARNAGLDAAKGDYICFIDSDDWAEPSYLDYLATCLEGSEKRIAACNHFIDSHNGMRTRFPVNNSVWEYDLRTCCKNVLYHGIPDVSPWGKLYRSDVFRGLRYFEGEICDDTFCIAELLIAGNGIVFGAKPQYHYSVLPSSLSRGQYNEHKLDFILAVEHMIEIIAARYPDLSDGCERRRVHAALSVRRYLVDCPNAQKALRDELESRVRDGACRVICDPSTPLRDKAGIVATLLGPKVYDFLWKLYLCGGMFM